MEKNKLYLRYTLVFFLAFLISTLPASIRSQIPLSFGLFTDGYKQHLVFLYDYVSQIKEALQGGLLPLYRFDMGLGSDFILGYTYYSLFDPMTVIAYIIPLPYIEFSYYLIGMIRLYLSGLFMIMLAKKMGIKKESILLVVGIFYSFNINTLYTAFRHPMFINGWMLFPLIVLGAEKVLRKESPLLLMAVSFYALIAQFYFFMFACVGFEVFVLLRSILNKDPLKEKTKGFFRVNFVYLFGALVGGFVLAPQLLASLSSGRIASKGFVFYDSLDMLAILGSFFAPVVGAHYTATIGNFIVLFFVIVFLIEHPKSWEGYFFVLISLMVLIPVFGYAFNLFSYINNRFSYLMLVPAGIILGRTLEEWEELPIQTIKKAGKIFVYLLILTLGFGLWYASSLLTNSILSLIGVIISVGITAFLFIRAKQKTLSFAWIKRISLNKLTKSLLIYSFVMIVGMASLYFVSLTAPVGLDSYQIDQYDFEDDGFYRVDQKVYSLNMDYLSNDSIINGYPSTYYYNTMSSGYISQVIDFYDVVNLNTTAGYNGFNNRMVLNAVHQVKYLLVHESEATDIPFGYIPKSSIEVIKCEPNPFNTVDIGRYERDENNQLVYETVDIYENQYFLPFGIWMDQFVLKEDTEALLPWQKEQLLLSAVLVEEEIAGLNAYTISGMEDFVRVDDYEVTNLTFDNQVLKAEDGAKITFTVPQMAHHELYINILNLERVDQNQDFEIVYEVNGAREVEATYAYGTNFYFPNPNHLVRVGYFEEETAAVTIYFPKGEYRFEKIGYFLQDTITVAAKIENLQDQTLQDLTITENGFTGNITTSSPGMLWFSLPYNRGFKAFVNGEEVPIQLVNIGYMGLTLPAGEHDISFVYQTPGMRAGLLISLGGIIACMLYMGGWLLWKRKKNQI